MRREALAEGEALLATNEVAHNNLQFRVNAIESCLAAHDWEEAARHARCLRSFTADEPLPWSDFVIERGLALASLGSRSPSEAEQVELRRLENAGQELGLLRSVVAIEAVLAKSQA